MRKLIATMNMTLDGFCDHTAMGADDELLQHYTHLLRNADGILYGRIAYQLMEYWQPIAKNPTGNRAMDEFAIAMDNIPKIVFSHTLNYVDWESARLAKGTIEEEVTALKQKTGKDILVGSPGLIAASANLDLIDEYQLCIHPVITGNGLSLFKNIDHRIRLRLLRTKAFGCGAVLLYYSR